MKKDRTLIEMRKVLQDLGIKNSTFLSEHKDPLTGKTREQLMNPQKRVLRSMKKLDKQSRIRALENLKLSLNQRQADNSLLENS